MFFRQRHSFLPTCVLALLAMLAAAPVAVAQTHGTSDTESLVIEGQIAPRLMNVGEHTYPITTSSPRAQLFFNQGLNLTYGFNHREAGRSFKEAARLDPACAMCYWGQALVLGPNINAPMSPEDEALAHELLGKARALSSTATEKERALIEALAARYSGNPEDRKARDHAFADAMRTVHQRFPDDLDIATLFAESLMDLRPWGYWTRDFKPYPETVEVLRALETVMERHPKHPGALHYYIHAVELPHPQRAEAAADKLLPLAPAAGHLVHMPSHIYRRVGRYADAARSNELAIAADEDYITQCRAQGIYPLAYYPHNVHFLWDASTVEGRSAVAIENAEKTATITGEHLHEMAMLQTFAVVPLHAYVRFGKWEKILALPEPPADQRYMTGMWHYARGLALTATGRLEEAGRELEKLSVLVSDPSLDDMKLFSNNTAGPVLRIAEQVLAGELAAKRGDYEKAIAHLHRGVLYEDALVYIEPPDWPQPVRQSLGAVLLEAGRPVEAEVVYWEDLKRNAENGWSLYGLVQALRAQGKDEEVAAVKRRFEKAWARADVQLTASRFMGPVPTRVASGQP